MDRHPRVNHPAELVVQDVSRFNNWVTEHLALALGSVTGMWLALTVPLIALPIPAFAKIVVIISSNWFQLWGLFCLQRTANRADIRRAAKADSDHEALTHIALTVDDIHNHQMRGDHGELANS